MDNNFGLLETDLQIIIAVLKQFPTMSELGFKDYRILD